MHQPRQERGRPYHGGRVRSSSRRTTSRRMGAAHAARRHGLRTSGDRRPRGSARDGTRSGGAARGGWSRRITPTSSLLHLIPLPAQRLDLGSVSLRFLDEPISIVLGSRLLEPNPVEMECSDGENAGRNLIDHELPFRQLGESRSHRGDGLGLPCMNLACHGRSPRSPDGRFEAACDEPQANDRQPRHAEL